MLDRIRVLIVDDHAMVRRGMRDFLDLHDDLEAVGEAADGEAALVATETLSPNAEADDLTGAIRSAWRGEVYFDPAVAGVVARRLRTGGGRDTAEARTQAALGQLTARERDVLACLAQGMSNRAIAEELGMAERTARTHASNILAKLGLTSRTQAALFAVEHGIPSDR